MIKKGIWHQYSFLKLLFIDIKPKNRLGSLTFIRRLANPSA